MGIWDEAQRACEGLDEERARHQQMKDEQLKAQQALVQAQQAAVREFIDAMRSMGITPQKQHFWKGNFLEPKRSRLHGIVGWGVEVPEGKIRHLLVVTADGRVYSLDRTTYSKESGLKAMMSPTPIDLTRLQAFGGNAALEFEPTPLIDLLRNQLEMTIRRRR